MRKKKKQEQFPHSYSFHSSNTKHFNINVKQLQSHCLKEFSLCSQTNIFKIHLTSFSILGAIAEFSMKPILGKYKVLKVMPIGRALKKLSFLFKCHLSSFNEQLQTMKLNAEWLHFTQHITYFCVFNISPTCHCILLSCADGEWLHPEQYLPRRLCPAQQEWGSAPCCPDARPWDFVQPPRPTSHRLLPLTSWPDTVMQQDTVNGQKHIDWTSLIHLDTQQTKLNNVGLYVFLFVHFEFIRFLFFLWGGGSMCCISSHIIIRVLCLQ